MARSSPLMRMKWNNPPPPSKKERRIQSSLIPIFKIVSLPGIKDNVEANVGNTIQKNIEQITNCLMPDQKHRILSLFWQRQSWMTENNDGIQCHGRWCYQQRRDGRQDVCHVPAVCGCECSTYMCRRAVHRHFRRLFQSTYLTDFQMSSKLDEMFSGISNTRKIPLRYAVTWSLLIKRAYLIAKNGSKKWLNVVFY